MKKTIIWLLKKLIKLLLPHYHLARNPIGSGRKKKEITEGPFTIIYDNEEMQTKQPETWGSK